MLDNIIWCKFSCSLLCVLGKSLSHVLRRVVSAHISKSSRKEGTLWTMRLVNDVTMWGSTVLLIFQQKCIVLGRVSTTQLEFLRTFPAFIPYVTVVPDKSPIPILVQRTEGTYGLVQVRRSCTTIQSPRLVGTCKLVLGSTYGLVITRVP